METMYRNRNMISGIIAFAITLIILSSIAAYAGEYDINIQPVNSIGSQSPISALRGIIITAAIVAAIIVYEVLSDSDDQEEYEWDDEWDDNSYECDQGDIEEDFVNTQCI